MWIGHIFKSFSIASLALFTSSFIIHYYHSLISTNNIQISICSKSKPLTSIHVFAQNEYSMPFQFQFKVETQMISRIHAVQVYMLHLNSECISFIKLEWKLIQWILIVGFCAIQTHSGWMFNIHFRKDFGNSNGNYHNQYPK